MFCVQNVTDVTIRLLIGRHKGVEPEEISEEYHRDFLDVMDRLGWQDRM